MKIITATEVEHKHAFPPPTLYFNLNIKPGA